MNKFGYSEMYEWSELFKFDIVPYGRFVTFDSNSPGKIRLAHTSDYVIGVTTINTVCTSDDPEEWQGKYLCNEYGDILLQKHNIVRAKEDYNDVEELPYITTFNDTEIVPVTNPSYKELEYIKRSNRQEWVRVNLLGKCIVTDNGECKSGKFCTVGEDGIAKPTDTLGGMPYVNKWYVISRLTENTIMIFFK
jgi:hypothetical protein